MELESDTQRNNGINRIQRQKENALQMETNTAHHRRAVRTEQQKADMFRAAGMNRKASDCMDKIKAYRSTYDDMCKKRRLAAKT